MGKVRELAVLQPCPVCLAGRAHPCKHKVTGRPLSKLHFGRTYGPAENLLNREVAKHDGMGGTEEFFRFAWIYLRLSQNEYPIASHKEEWEELYAKHPDLQDMYFGDW